MAQTNFIDHVKLNFRSGHGGAGAVHFRREKHVPLGGPDGGDGGRGGNIILRGNSQLWTLLHLKYRKHVIADDGERGGASGSTGAQGKDIILDVPIGTVAKDDETGEIKGEVVEDGQELIIAPGGRGGLGNTHFKTATNQAPRHAQPGENGIDEWFVLELKLLADVGLVGFPNAGKSTLLASISAAKPEIADYAFTTLTPNLGVIPYRDFRSFVMADIPGIIEGAAQGKGLGTRFLRHIERNSILLFMIPSDAEDINAAYKILLGELQQYNPELLDKQRFLAITKSDLLDDELQQMIATSLEIDIPHMFISAVTGKGLDKLKDRLWEMLQG